MHVCKITIATGIVSNALPHTFLYTSTKCIKQVLGSLQSKLAKVLHFPRLGNQFNLVLQRSNQSVARTHKHLQIFRLTHGICGSRLSEHDATLILIFIFHSCKTLLHRLDLQLSFFAFPRDPSFVELPTYLSESFE